MKTEKDKMDDFIQDPNYENNPQRESDEEYIPEGICLECGQKFPQDRDLQICDKCVGKFDLDKLWTLHDENKIDALDFNESKKIREMFRKKRR